LKPTDTACCGVNDPYDKRKCAKKINGWCPGEDPLAKLGEGFENIKKYVLFAGIVVGLLVAYGGTMKVSQLFLPMKALLAVGGIGVLLVAAGVLIAYFSILK
jgi:hypothetical protein